MPGYRAHLTGGFSAYAACILLLVKGAGYRPSDNEIILGLIMCLLGSLFPDIDIKSKGQKVFYYFFFICLIAALLKRDTELFILGSLACFIPLLSRHRGVVHRSWFIVLAPLLIPFLLMQLNLQLQNRSFLLYAFFVLGAFSHLFFDFGARRLTNRILWRFKR